jgi:ketosteroid isomerase-like protein
MAYETATETVTSTQGKKVVTSHPFGTVIWKKQADGSWKAVLDQSIEEAPAVPGKK